MTIILGEFKKGIKQALGRGSALDDVITSKIRQAVTWVERNVDPGYKYMLQYRTLVLSSSGDYPEVIDTPNDRLKSIELLRIVRDDGTYDYLSKIHPADVTALNVAKPQGYWIDGRNRIVLDAKPAEDYNAEMISVEYSSWSDSDTFTHWLLSFAEDLLFAQTMLQLSPWTRDPKMRATFQKDRDEALVTLEGQKIDLDFENSLNVMRLKVAT